MQLDSSTGDSGLWMDVLYLTAERVELRS